MFVLGWLLVGLASAGTFYPPAFAALTHWYGAGRVRAITTLTLVAGFASTIFAPLTAALGERFGWRDTYLILAALLLVIPVPAHALTLRLPWHHDARGGHARADRDVGIIRRSKSEGDRRRSYVRLRPDNPLLAALNLAPRLNDELSRRRRVVFMCTRNSARSSLAKVEGHSNDGHPTVLFLCTHNAGRSQMALGFFQYLAGDAAVGWSGGSEPGDGINPVVVQAMKERGIDIAEEFPKPWTDETVRAADVVITMGCGDACPIFPGKRYQEWELDDPAGQDLETVRAIRDQVEDRVRHLLAELDVASHSA